MTTTTPSPLTRPRAAAAPATTTAGTEASATTEAPATSTADTEAGATTEASTAGSAATTAECPDGDSIPVAVPYEANQPAGANWRLGLEMAVAEINEAGGILGCQIVPEFQDTQADPDVSKQVVADMAEGDPYVFLGTVFSSNTIVNMVEAQRAEIPMFVGAEAPAITNREENGDNNFIYRTSFGVDTAADKFIDYIVDQGVTSVDMIYKNDEFGAGGRDAYAAAFEEVGIEVQLDIQVQPDQIDLSAEVAQLAGGGADAIFAFMTEIETAAFLDEVQAQALAKPIYGGDVLSAASTIALVQPGAADGTRTHAGLNASAPVFADWKEAYAAFHPSADPPDHNSIKGYTAVYIVKEATERIGSFDNTPVRRHAVLRHDHRGGRARRAARRQLRRQRGHRPRELHRRGRRRGRPDHRHRPAARQPGRSGLLAPSLARVARGAGGPSAGAGGCT